MANDPTRDHLNRKLRTITHCALYGRTLRLVCAYAECGHVRVFDAIPLWWLYSCRGWDDRLPSAVRRFYCSRCWRVHRCIRRPCYLVTEEQFDETKQFPYPLETEWSCEC